MEKIILDTTPPPYRSFFSKTIGTCLLGQKIKGQKCYIFNSGMEG